MNEMVFDLQRFVKNNNKTQIITMDNSKITFGGVYKISSGFTGTITIDTTEAVTLDGADATWLTDLQIVTESETADLTIKDLYVTQQRESTIRFGSGTGNKLTIEGQNVFDSGGTPSNGDGAAEINIGGGLTVDGTGSLTIKKGANDKGGGIGTDWRE